jgi:protein-S-isoprenylcysteine O-methyltransferase Ste14
MFTFAFNFVVSELPRQINRLLKDHFPDYGVSSIEQRLLAENQFRPIGYLCFIGVLLLIVLGFLSKRSKFTFLGSLGFYLPIFGHFAGTMFFFAGIGILRVIWMPLIDIFSTDLLAFGEIVLLPHYLIKEVISDLVGGNPVIIVDFVFDFSNALMSLGMLIFLFSTITWMYGRFTSQPILNFWIYKYSRHPQYLGLLVWSYGLLIQIESFPYPHGGYIPVSSFPWVISALIIIGIAMQEELNLQEKYTDAYTAYCEKTSFILPLPRRLSRFVTKLNGLLIRKARPEGTKDILILLGVYGCISIVLSLLYI